MKDQYYIDKENFVCDSYRERIAYNKGYEKAYEELKPILENLLSYYKKQAKKAREERRYFDFEYFDGKADGVEEIIINELF